MGPIKKHLIDVPNNAKEILTVYLVPEGIAIGMCSDFGDALRDEQGSPHILINGVVAAVRDTLETALRVSDGSRN